MNTAEIQDRLNRRGEISLARDLDNLFEGLEKFDRGCQAHGVWPKLYVIRWKNGNVSLAHDEPETKHNIEEIKEFGLTTILELLKRSLNAECGDMYIAREVDMFMARVDSIQNGRDELNEWLQDIENTKDQGCEFHGGTD